MSNTKVLPCLPPVRSFRFKSRAGTDYGVYEGHTVADALAVLHSDSGYSRNEVRLSADRERMTFCSPEMEELLGGPDRWHVTDLGPCGG